MREKVRNKKGFTLAELLIVVAIIAILIAIMVPVFGTSRANATMAKNAANIRSAYSEAVTDALAKNNYEGEKLKVDITIDESQIKGSTFTVSDDKITVSTPGADPATLDIALDKDVKVTIATSSTPAAP